MRKPIFPLTLLNPRGSSPFKINSDASKNAGKKKDTALHGSVTRTFFFLINMGVRASLRVSRLILRVLKLTTI
jgi:hypothetical protein